MGKVITNKIVVIDKDQPVLVERPFVEQVLIERNEPMMITADGPVKVPEPMHLNEETVFVFDQSGNCVGHMKHGEIKELQKD